MKKNIKGFSIVIAMGLVLVTSLFAYTILEYMIPFSKNVKGIENSSKAYYQANSGIEKGLYFFGDRDDESIRDEDTTNSSIDMSLVDDFEYTTISSSAYDFSNLMPFPDEGNSEYNDDYNVIKIGEPIQLSVGYDFIDNIDLMRIYFKVPKIEGIDYALSGATTNDIINWQISSSSDTLNASSSLVTVADIEDYNTAENDIYLYNLMGENLSGGSETLKTFFNNNNCDTSTERCILKFSLVNDIQSVDNLPVAGINSISLPYLEWKLDTGSSLNNIPLRYSKIESKGKSSGFSRELEVRYPQETVSEAFDFTVFQ